MARTAITDLDIDAMAQCANYLDVKDVSNLAMTSNHLKTVAYSDPVWQSLFRKAWPFQMSPTCLPATGIKEAYLARHVAVQQFKFNDPWSSKFPSESSPHTRPLIDKNDIILSQDSEIVISSDAFLFGKETVSRFRNHNARITCMRLFPLYETSLLRSELGLNQKFLITSSSDHSIRLWWKGRCHRCYRGHNGPVTTLADRLLGDMDSTGKLLASGGEDGTVRLWSLTSGGQRGKQALITTFYGHEKPIALLSVSGHKSSLLVSMSINSKLRVWDATRSSSSHASGCVGMASAAIGYGIGGSKSREPVGLKCHESLMYVASGSLVTAIDVRTMQHAFTSAVQPNMRSFEMLPSKSLICTGGRDRAMLWDVRRSQRNPQPVHEFGQLGPVTSLHVDTYKVVTGSPSSSDINVWDPNTGILLNLFKCYEPEDPQFIGGCSSLAVNGSRVVVASMDEDKGYVFYKDYKHATSSSSSFQTDSHSKFWESGIHYDSDE